MFPPFFNDDQRFPKAVEDLSVAQFISEPAVEARTVSIKIYINQLFKSEPTEVKVAIVNRHKLDGKMRSPKLNGIEP